MVLWKAQWRLLHQIFQLLLGVLLQLSLWFLQPAAGLAALDIIQHLGVKEKILNGASPFVRVGHIMEYIPESLLEMHRQSHRGGTMILVRLTGAC